MSHETRHKWDDQCKCETWPDCIAWAKTYNLIWNGRGGRRSRQVVYEIERLREVLRFITSVSCQIDSKMKRWWKLLVGFEYPTDLDTEPLEGPAPGSGRACPLSGQLMTVMNSWEWSFGKLEFCISRGFFIFNYNVAIKEWVIAQQIWPETSVHLS